MPILQVKGTEENEKTRQFQADSQQKTSQIPVKKQSLIEYEWAEKWKKDHERIAGMNCKCHSNPHTSLSALLCNCKFARFIRGFELGIRNREIKLIGDI